MEVIFEYTFWYLGMVLCIVASINLYRSGAKLLALLFIAGFILQFQSIILYDFIFPPMDASRECWGSDFNYCSQIIRQISSYATQIGVYIMAAAVFILSTRKSVSTYVK